MPAFNLLFDLYFRSGGHGPEDQGDREPPDPDDFRAEVADALTGGGEGGLGGLARRAVDAFGRVDPARGHFSGYEVARALRLDGLVQDLLSRNDDDAPDALERSLRRAEVARRAARLREAILADTRRRVAEVRGPDAVAAYAVGPLPEDVNFLSALADMDDLRRALPPLARKLAVRVAMRRRRALRGQLDIRKTVRHSLSTGGVPFDTSLRRRAPHRPELFVLCDLSGSVARFARFALMLTHSLSAQFTRVRSFAFVDTIEEVTRFFDDEDFLAAVDRMNSEARIVRAEGRSDYGWTFKHFWETYGSDVTSKTTLLILGDARNNYRLREAWALKALQHRAHHAYWLNPESQSDWNTGDSVAADYAPYVDKMIEVRNLRQLQDFIAREL
jgi:uncharacterized protein with von Willebrand factor type A (vWA) domain